MYRIPLFAAVAALWAAPSFALPADPHERAIACYVYGAWAGDDPRSEAAKAAIQAAIDEALAAGAVTEEDLQNEFSETATLALYEQPRAQLIANWNDCRESFAPL